MNFRLPLWRISICGLVALLSILFLSHAWFWMGRCHGAGAEMAAGAGAFEKGRLRRHFALAESAQLYEAEGPTADDRSAIHRPLPSVVGTNHAGNRPTDQAVSLAEPVKDKVVDIQAKSNSARPYGATRRTDLAETIFSRHCNWRRQDQTGAAATIIISRQPAATQENFAEP